MRIETFRNRLQSGKGSTYTYRHEDRMGGINIWRYQDKFVLTWEEATKDDFYNESNYIRDEVHHFESVEEVLTFLERNAVDVTKFTP